MAKKPQKKPSGRAKQAFDKRDQVIDELQNRLAGMTSELRNLKQQLSMQEEQHANLRREVELETILRQELDLEGLLRTFLEIILRQFGPHTMAIFTFDEHSLEYKIGAYSNTDIDIESQDPRGVLDEVAHQIQSALIDSTCDRADFIRQFPHLNRAFAHFSTEGALEQTTFGNPVPAAVMLVSNLRNDSYDQKFIKGMESAFKIFGRQWERAKNNQSRLHRDRSDRGFDMN
jgi:hypothetical protein